MQIQVNSSNDFDGNARLDQWVRSTLQNSLERYAEDLLELSDPDA